MADKKWKETADDNLGQLNSLNPTDLIPVIRSPYNTTNNDGYVFAEDLLPDRSGDEAIYNAITDGGIEADYTDRLNPGTDQNPDIISWIETNGLPNGKRRFYFPAGHYRIVIGTTEPTNLDIRGYDNVEIFGAGMGKTVFHYAQDYSMNTVSKGFIRIGWLSDAFNTHVHDITIKNDPYATHVTDDGTADFGWVYYPVWKASTDYEAGDRVHSVADDFIIEYQEDATSAATEPTWVAGSMTDNTYDVEVQALANRVNSTAYSVGDHYKTTAGANEYNSTRSLARCHVAGTTAAAEVTLRRPSSDGAGSTAQNNCMADSYNAHNTLIQRVEFVGVSGFNEAGGTAIGVTNDGNDGARIRDCVFRDFNYGTAMGGYGNGLEITNCYFYKTGGWGYQYGTYNAHGMYLQGGGHLIAYNKFDSHYYGLDIKTHNNASAQDLIGNKLIGNVHLNYGWAAVEILDPDTYTVTGNENFIPQSTSGTYWTAAMSQQLMVSNCHFRIERSVHEDWNDWGGTPGDGYAISCGSSGTIVTGCTFMDTYGLRAYPEDTVQDYDDTTVSMIATGCSFRAIFRHCIPITGAVKLSDSEIDFRALDLGASSDTSIFMNDYSTIKDCRIFARNVTSASRYTGFVELDGKNTTFENNFVSIDGTGYIGFCSQKAAASAGGCVIRNNRIIAPNATLYWSPNEDSIRGNIFEGNYWDIDSWEYCRNIREKVTFRNETGNLWGEMNQWLTGEVMTIETSVYRTSKGHLVDRDGAKVTDPADIFGFSVKNSDNASQYTSFICVSEKTWQWMQTDSAVTVDDYVVLSTTAGRVDPNGTTGSTTEPTSGFYGIVYDVGTASAGAGRALVYIKHFNLLATGSVSDTAYGVGWDGDTTGAASKNAIYDKVDAMDTAIGLNTAKTSNATHTGDVTGATALTIADEAVTLAKMAHMATASLLGRNTAATGDPEVLSAATARSLLGVSADTATRLNTLWIPASAMNEVTTNGATPGSVERAVNDVMIETMDFDTATHQYAQFAIAMPKSWNEGTLTARFYWVHGSTTVNFGVVWEIQGFHCSDANGTDGTWGTLQEIGDTGATNGDLHLSGWTPAITPNYTAVQDDVIFWRVGRQVADDGDNMAIDAQLLGVTLRYTSNNITDT